MAYNKKYVIYSPMLLLFCFLINIFFNVAQISNDVPLEEFLRQDQEEQDQPQQPWTYYKPKSDAETYYNSVVNDEEPQILLNYNEDDNDNLKLNELFDDDENNNFFALSPSIGQTSGLAINLDGNLVLFHRSYRVWDKNSFTSNNVFNKQLKPIENFTIAVIDSNNGHLISEHGANQFYMPHGLSIDSEGNHWVTDVGSHQVFKLDKNFKTLMVLGKKLVPGDDNKHFCKPTDVAVAKNGDFFISDGYCNSRIMKFEKNGKFIMSFGKPTTHNPPETGEFFVPHSLALIESLDLLCIADRENKRIQCFVAGINKESQFYSRAYIPTGTFFTKAENIGRIYAIREKNNNLVGVTNQEENDQNEPEIFVMDINTGQVNTFAKGLENAHALAIGKDSSIFISQMNPNQIVKFAMPNQD